MAARAGAVIAAVGRGHRRLGLALGRLDDDELLAPSLLPDWDRATVVRHLRFGAETSLRMTEDALSGRPTRFYPAGRAAMRPSTLAPRPGERPVDAVVSLLRASERLDRRWAGIDASGWATDVREPEGEVDLGSINLAWLALLRLTEVEVHSSDLGLAALGGVNEWSRTFVDVALPSRLRRLAVRRSNHRPADVDLDGVWRFWPRGRPTIEVRSTAGRVEVDRRTDIGVVPGPGEATDGSRIAALRGEGRDILAMLLGRGPLDRLELGGDVELAARFQAAFPGP